MTKADVLSGFDEIRVCTSYRMNGVIGDELPYSIDPEQVEPVYTSLPGWEEDLTAVRRYDDIPVNLRNYVDFIERALKVPVSILSVGPDREQTIEI
jgi:adenylosuccinate synthase